jgi:homoaconitase/3-isopropylmalate dehydratase large subunit
MPDLEHGAHPNDVAERFIHALKQQLEDIRGFERMHLDTILELPSSRTISIHDVLSSSAECLRRASNIAEADVLDVIRAKIAEQPAFGGLGIASEQIPSDTQYDEIKFLCESWLESLNSQERAQKTSRVSTQPTPGVRPMTLAEKIFAHHCHGSVPPSGVSAGDVIVVGIDWVLASELSWAGMARTYEEMGAPGIWRNDRFWLAGDHVVHPSIVHVPKIKTFVETAEKAKKAFKMTEYQGMNYTIMHTEFVRERAEPGMLCIGSDSHTCSAGAAGCLAIGLGTADVMMALALGETWFKVPESISIEIQGKPATGISGKDVILHILKVFKRNTIAAERIVEFSGPGLQNLSYDARFAISNMCTEFGAVTGVFVPDQVTKDFIDQRKRRNNRSNSVYFKPDDDAYYAGRYTINLSEVEPSVAVYPNPDDVVPVSEKAGLKLDGVFIGACTTTEEELVLAALILKVGLSKNLPLAKGKKHYVPGSLPTVERLRDLHLLEVYEAAGFTRGPPGCSFCVGLSAEKAAEGETWLSSQNRNFKNRMGKGSIGHVTSAIVCAASAFSMTVTSPLEFLKEIDESFLESYKTMRRGNSEPVTYVQPDLSSAEAQLEPTSSSASSAPLAKSTPSETVAPEGLRLIESKVVRLGDFIDTDAVSTSVSLLSR